MRKLIALASVLSAALLAAGCADDSDPEADPSATPSATSEPSAPSESPSPSETTSEPPATGAGTKLTTSGLAEGAPPAIAYLVADDPADPADHWHLVRADGSELALPGHGGVFTFAPMGQGIVTVDDDGSGAVATVIDGQGTEVRSTEARGYDLAVSPDGSIVGWLGGNGAPQVIEGGGVRSWDLPVVTKGADLGALQGQETCKEDQSAIGGCTAFVNDLTRTQVFVSTSHGIVDVAGRMRSAADVSASGLVVGLVSITDDGSCSGVWRNTFRKPKWQTCDHTLLSFSPNGSRVLGTDPYLDGIGQRTVAFLDGDGTVLHTFVGGRNGPYVIQTAWEDDDHVLALVLDRGGWAVLRLGVDGSMEYAVAPVPGDETARPFGLPAE